MLQLNIQCSWWWAYAPETCRAKNTSIKLPSSIKLAFHFISWGRCTVKQPSNTPLLRRWGSNFLRNSDIYLPNYMTSHSKRTLPGVRIRNPIQWWAEHAWRSAVTEEPLWSTVQEYQKANNCNTCSANRNNSFLFPRVHFNHPIAAMPHNIK